ncbi:hypothetical protein [Thalassobacillus hwangdonensis]|uniref:3-methyladenine DNA glycosylase n=1 Tax=Thalassobacillus hwangdonensis TaxID=546108 RepID=A0ABW3L6Q6_9BACI
MSDKKDKRNEREKIKDELDDPVPLDEIKKEEQEQRKGEKSKDDSSSEDKYDQDYK